LVDARLEVDDIDMIAFTSTQCYELVVIDKPNELQLEYGEDLNKKFISTLHDKHFTQEDERFQNHLVGDIINNIYSSLNNDNYIYHKSLFPEYK